jgi:hypothetical protein
MSRPSHSPCFDHCNNIWWRIQIMALLTMQITPASGYFLRHRSKHSSEHAKVSVFPLMWQITRFTLISNQEVLGRTSGRFVGSSELLMTLASTVKLCFWYRQDPWPCFFLSEILRVLKWGLLFGERRGHCPFTGGVNPLLWLALRRTNRLVSFDMTRTT